MSAAETNGTARDDLISRRAVGLNCMANAKQRQLGNYSCPYNLFVLARLPSLEAALPIDSAARRSNVVVAVGRSATVVTVVAIRDAAALRGSHYIP